MDTKPPALKMALHRNTVARHLSFSGATPRIPLADAANVPKRVRLSDSAVKKRPREPSPPRDVCDPIAVVLRVRPFSSVEKAREEENAISVKGELVHIRPKTLTLQNDAVRQQGHASFRFSNVLHQHATQADVFRHTTRHLVECFIAGRSAVLLAYGHTGAGKTWTIQGNHAQPGTLPRALRLILTSVAPNAAAHLSAPVRALTRASPEDDVGVVDVGPPVTVDSTLNYEVTASYLEVYNDQVYDLFRPRDDDDVDARRPALRLKEHSGGDVYAAGATEVPLRSLADARALLMFGQSNRRVAHTAANSRSSRSHALFCVALRTVSPRKPPRTARLYFVDLAGSERTARTKGARLREAASINKSLMTLGRCLNELRRNQRVLAAGHASRVRIVPFRSSKLTRLLQPALLCGNAVIIVNASPALADADDTIHMMRCAALARQLTQPASHAPRRALRAPPPPRGKGGGSCAVARGRVAKENVAVGKKTGCSKLNDLVKEIAAVRKSAALDRMEKEEEHCARVEAERELHQMYGVVENLRDRIDKYEKQIGELEVKIRAEVVNETEKIIEEIQAQHDEELAEARAEHIVVQRRFSLLSKTSRKTFAQRVARRASMVVQQNIAMEVDEDEEDKVLDDDDILFRDTTSPLSNNSEELRLLTAADLSVQRTANREVRSEEEDSLELDGGELRGDDDLESGGPNSVEVLVDKFLQSTDE